MLKQNAIRGSMPLRIAIASLLGLGMSVGVQAQQAPASRPASTLEEVPETVIVTGSYIRGTPEDAALPVDVLSAEDLEEQGAPTVVQLVKTITASGSAIGESNRYAGGAGTASINLRGFGAARTLVLMNGRRLAINPQSAGYNLNFIPQAAVGRMEMLKDGAAVTYGSDAVGGVVNFLTRTDLNGLEVDGEYSYIDGSDGDYQANLAWGSKFDNGNLLFAMGYRARSRMDIHERDWALTRFEDPGYGGWTGASNPGFYNLNVPPGSTTNPRTQFRDNGCTELGGQLTSAISNPAGAPTTDTANANTCRYQFSNFNDLVNDEDHYQLYGEGNINLNDTVELHTEIAWARDQVHDQRLSPANLMTQFPSAASRQGTSGSQATPGALNFFVPYNVPGRNPGLRDLAATCASTPLGAAAGVCAGLTSAAATTLAGLPQSTLLGNGVDISQTGFRAIAFAGHPTNPDGADHQNIQQDAFRVSTGLKGSIGESTYWDTAVTYMRAQSEVSTNDLIVTNIQLALNGFGSLAGEAPCTTRDVANAGNAAMGCYYFNPFTNGLAVSRANGARNPYYRGDVNPALVNNPKLVEWLYGNYVNETTNQIFVWDGVFSGEMPIALPGGNIGWALGAQYRWTENKEDYGDLFDSKVTPCVDSVDDSTPVCGAPAGPLIFFGSNTDDTFSRDVVAVFTEINIPIFDSFSANIAGRFEDYGSGIGSTTDPKLALRWQALDWLALRGSVGTTFRAPGLSQTDPGCRTGVANINGQYRGVETCGNPNLKPETADTYNLGLMINAGGFSATLDYFNFKFEGELTTESSSRLFASMFPATPAGMTEAQWLASAQHPCQTLPALRDRFTFAGGTCSPGNVLRINVLDVNGPTTETSGFDLRMQYDWSMFNGDATVGVEATYLNEFKRGAFTLNGAPNVIFAAPEDRAGKHDLVSQFFSYPKTRANFFVAYRLADISFRLQTRFTEGTEGAFGTPLNEWVPDSSDPDGWTQRAIGKTDDFIQHDLIVRWQAPWQTVITGSIQNLLDEDPSDAPSQYNYDYTNGNPLGRVFEVNVKKKF